MKFLLLTKKKKEKVRDWGKFVGERKQSGVDGQIDVTSETCNKFTD